MLKDVSANTFAGCWNDRNSQPEWLMGPYWHAVLYVVFSPSQLSNWTPSLNSDRATFSIHINVIHRALDVTARSHQNLQRIKGQRSNSITANGIVVISWLACDVKNKSADQGWLFRSWPYAGSAEGTCRLILLYFSVSRCWSRRWMPLRVSSEE